LGSASMKPTVVWEGPAGLDWGRSWMECMLQRVDVNYKFVKTTKNLQSYDKCIVVTNTSASYDYIEQLQEDKKSFGVVLLSDECLVEPMFYLEDPNCKFAARTYFHPGYYEHPKVFVFGLGYKQDFEKYIGNTSVVPGRRAFDWSFAGSLKMDRSECLRVLNENFPKNPVFIFEKFNDPKHFNAEGYARLVESSTFIPCPQGGAILDSFRIYEALEANSIPVTLKNSSSMKIEPSYWHGVFVGAGTLPFVCTDTWEEAATEMKRIRDNNEISKVRRQCKHFWEFYVALWQKEFEKRIALL